MSAERDRMILNLGNGSGFSVKEVIEAAREFCEARYQQDPRDPGMALLAAQFTETDRVEYLEKT